MVNVKSQKNHTHTLKCLKLSWSKDLFLRRNQYVCFDFIKMVITKKKKFNFYLFFCSDGAPYISVLKGASIFGSDNE